jgi:hypothetical protein
MPRSSDVKRARPLASLPGPSRRITVEPVKVPVQPEKRPVEKPPEPVKPDPVPVP